MGLEQGEEEVHQHEGFPFFRGDGAPMTKKFVGTFVPQELHKIINRPTLAETISGEFGFFRIAPVVLDPPSFPMKDIGTQSHPFNVVSGIVDPPIFQKSIPDNGHCDILPFFVQMDPWVKKDE